MANLYYIFKSISISSINVKSVMLFYFQTFNLTHNNILLNITQSFQNKDNNQIQLPMHSLKMFSKFVLTFSYLCRPILNTILKVLYNF